MRVRIVDRCKIWDIEIKENVSIVTFSCSRKATENDEKIAKNGYVTDYHRYVRFVGKAHKKLENFLVGDEITNLEAADETTTPYWDKNSNSIAYPKNQKLTVFDFEKYERRGNNNTNLDTAPEVEESNNINNNNIVEKNSIENSIVEATNLSADDECPF